MLERLFHLAELFDMYGMLLTEKQRRCLELHLFDDFSLAEVGEAVGVSRQAAYDIIHRSEQALEGYEEKLGLLPKSTRNLRRSARRFVSCARKRTMSP